jgi:ribosomal protein S18 acetylase RimI-like enzyme
MPEEAEAPPRLLVRPARREEAATIADFQLRMARETEGLELDPGTLAAGVEGVFAEPGRGVYWVAAAAERVVGSLLTTYEWSDWRNGRIWWIQSVYVLPEWRGRGVYRRLYEHLRATVEGDPGVRGLRLYVDRRNAAAQEVYERLGMTKEHYELYEWLKG